MYRCCLRMTMIIGVLIINTTCQEENRSSGDSMLDLRDSTKPFLFLYKTGTQDYSIYAAVWTDGRILRRSRGESKTTPYVKGMIGSEEMTGIRSMIQMSGLLGRAYEGDVSVGAVADHVGLRTRIGVRDWAYSPRNMKDEGIAALWNHISKIKIGDEQSVDCIEAGAYDMCPTDWRK